MVPFFGGAFVHFGRGVPRPVDSDAEKTTLLDEQKPVVF